MEEATIRKLIIRRVLLAGGIVLAFFIAYVCVYFVFRRVVDLNGYVSALHFEMHPVGYAVVDCQVGWQSMGMPKPEVIQYSAYSEGLGIIFLPMLKLEHRMLEPNPVKEIEE